MANHYGGTWEQITNRFLYASGTYAVGSEGGEATHTLTSSEMPSHTHTQNAHHHNLWSSNSYNGDVCGFGNVNGRSVGGVQKQGTHGWYEKGISSEQLVSNATPTINSAGGGSAHNNMPPYRVVYMFRRLT